MHGCNAFAVLLTQRFLARITPSFELFDFRIVFLLEWILSNAVYYTDGRLSSSETLLQEEQVSGFGKEMFEKGTLPARNCRTYMAVVVRGVVDNRKRY